MEFIRYTPGTLSIFTADKKVTGETNNNYSIVSTIDLARHSSFSFILKNNSEENSMSFLIEASNNPNGESPKWIPTTSEKELLPGETILITESSVSNALRIKVKNKNIDENCNWISFIRLNPYSFKEEQFSYLNIPGLKLLINPRQQILTGAVEEYGTDVFNEESQLLDEDGLYLLQFDSDDEDGTVSLTNTTISNGVQIYEGRNTLYIKSFLSEGEWDFDTTATITNIKLKLITNASFDGAIVEDFINGGFVNQSELILNGGFENWRKRYSLLLDGNNNYFTLGLPAEENVDPLFNDNSNLNNFLDVNDPTITHNDTEDGRIGNFNLKVVSSTNNQGVETVVGGGLEEGSYYTWKIRYKSTVPILVYEGEELILILKAQTIWTEREFTLLNNSDSSDYSFILDGAGTFWLARFSVVIDNGLRLNGDELILSSNDYTFEEDDTSTNWTDEGNHVLSISDDDSNTGDYSLKVVSSGIGDFTDNRIILTYNNFLNLVIGRSYTLQMYVKTLLNNTELNIKIGDKEETFDEDFSSSFTKVVYNFVATANTLNQDLILNINQSDTIYIDDISLTESFSMTCLIRGQRLINNGESGLITINGVENNEPGYQLYFNDNILTSVVKDENGMTSSNSSSLEDMDLWQIKTYTMSIDRKLNLCKVFIDTTEVDSFDISNVGKVIPDVENYLFGNREGDLFKGELNFIQFIKNKILDEDELEDIIENDVKENYTDGEIVLYQDFREIDGANFIDNTIYLNDLILVGNKKYEELNPSNNVAAILNGSSQYYTKSNSNNLLTNGTFESGTNADSWSTTGTVTFNDTELGKTGTYCAKIVSTGVHGITKTLLTIGKTYKLNIKYKVITSGVTLLIGNNTTANAYKTLEDTMKQWNVREISFVATETTLSIKTSASGTVYVDDIDIREDIKLDLNGVELIKSRPSMNGENYLSGYQFDGVNDYVSVANNANLNFGTGDFSVEVYFKTPPTLAGNQTILTKGIPTNTDVYGYLINTNGSTLTALASYTSAYASYLFLLTGTIAVNTNYHLVITVNRAGSAIMYLNGVNVASEVISSKSDVTVSQSYNMLFGSRPTLFDRFFAGTLYYSRLFNRALSSGEVTTLYNNGRPDLASLNFADLGASNTSLVTGDNSTFSSDTGFWTKTHAGITISSGTANWDGTAGTGQGITRSSLFIIGKKYKLVYEITEITSGTVRFYHNGEYITVDDFGNGFGNTGIKTITFIASSSSLQIFGSNSAIAKIDNLTVTPLGCVAEYRPENATSATWTETQNNLHGTTSGSPALSYALPGKWYPVGNHSQVESSSEDKYAGDRSIKMTSTGVGDSSSNHFILNNSELETIVEGEKYTLEFFARGSGVLGSDLIINGVNWTDTNADGLADNWTTPYPASSFSIITGSGGFSGNAQRVVRSSTIGSTVGIQQSTDNLISGKSYYCSFKYRSSKEGFSVFRGGQQVLISNVPINTGNAVFYEGRFTATDNGKLTFLCADMVVGVDYFEIDEVNLQEITQPSITAVIGGQNKISTNLSVIPGTFTKYVFNFQATANEVNQPLKLFINQADSVFIDSLSLTKAYDAMIAMWVKPNVSSNGRVLDTQTASAVNLGFTALIYGSDNGVLSNSILFYTLSSGYVNSGTNSINQGEWNFVIARYDRIENLSLRVNEDDFNNVSIANVGKYYSLLGIRIGARLYSAAQYLNAEIGELQIVRFTDISENTPNANYLFNNKRLLTFYEGGEVVMHYKWNDSDNRVKDYSLLSNHLTATGSPTYGLADLDFNNYKLQLINWSRKTEGNSYIMPSVINTRDVSTLVSPKYALKFVIDDIGSEVSVKQIVTLEEDTKYTITLYARKLVDNFNFILNIKNGEEYLQDDLETYDTTPDTITSEIKTTFYKRKQFTFMSRTAGEYEIELKNDPDNSVGNTLLFDNNFSLKKFPNGNHGVMENLMENNQLIHTSGFILDGIDDFVDFGNVYEFGDNSFLIFNWIKVEESENSNRVIWSKKGTEEGWSFFINENKLSAVYNTTLEENIFLGNKIITDGRWHLATMIVDRTNDRVLLYVDLQQDNTTLTGDIHVPSNNDLLLGADGEGGSGYNDMIFGAGGLCIFDGEDGSPVTLPNYEKIIREIYYNTRPYYLF